jgi:hypothetical protein
MMVQLVLILIVMVRHLSCDGRFQSTFSYSFQNERKYSSVLGANEVQLD